MAGDWIKVENVTPDKPEIDAIAEHLGVSVNEVIGGLVRLWIWADQQTIDGNAVSVTKCAIDRHSGVTNLADTMLLAHIHWLEKNPNGGFSFPNFDRHNGQTAKRRALTAKRVAKSKKRNGNAEVTLSALPREEKRRDISNPTLPSEKSKFKKPNVVDIAIFCTESKLAVDPQDFYDYYQTQGWKLSNGNAMKDWQAAVRKWARNKRNNQGDQQTPKRNYVDE